MLSNLTRWQRRSYHGTFFAGTSVSIERIRSSHRRGYGRGGRGYPRATLLRCRADPAGRRIHHRQRRQTPAAGAGDPCRPAHCGYAGKYHYDLAAVVEFIHTATLLHDDVVDESELRRGKATANALFGNAASVLVGDFLYSRAFQMMVEVDNMRVMRVLADATNIIAEGEVLQLELPRPRCRRGRLSAGDPL